MSDKDISDQRVSGIRTVAIDLQPVQGFSSRHRGIGRYVLELATAMVEHHPDRVHSLLIHARRGIPPELERFVGTGLLRAHSPEPPVHNGRTPDVYLVTSPYEGDLTLDEVWPRWARKRPVDTAVVLYDLIPNLFPEHYLSDPVWESKQWARTEFVKHADLVMCISKATASDALEHLGLVPERVTTIGTGVSDHFSVASDPARSLAQAVAAVDGLRAGFVMYTGGIDYRKNLNGLLEAYALVSPEIRKDHQLVIVCKLLPTERQVLEDHASALGISDDVLLTGFVPDTTLAFLYQSADLFVFPSIYEGFGLPVAEAALSGTLAVASNSSSMTELVLDPELRFDPHDPGDIARCITNALDLTDTDERAAKQRNRIRTEFMWERVASRTVDAIDHLVPKTAGRSARSRIAMVTPVPPAVSGIADYSWRLAHALAEYVDVDVIPEDPSTLPTPLSPHIRVTNDVGLLTRDSIVGYDEVIYVMGNSSHHATAYELMGERRGTVMIHEARFTGFIEWYGQTQGDGLDWFHEELGEEYWSIKPTYDHEEWNTYEISASEGYYMTGTLVDKANRLLTTSDFTAELARLQRPDRSDDIVNVGFGYPEPARIMTRVTVEWLATFGYQHEIKATDVVVEAFALLADEHPDLKLAIVGHVSAEFLPVIQKLITDLDISDRVVITSHVEAGEYESWLKRTDIAIHLRRATNGEVSAAIGDSLRFGIPTIVTEVGTAATMPDTCVDKVAVDASPQDLADSIRTLIGDDDRRKQLAAGALSYVRNNSFDAAARRLLDAIGLTATTD